MDSKVEEYFMMIGGENKRGSTEEEMEVRNPSSGLVFAKVPKATITDLEYAIDTAKQTFEAGTWSRMPPGERSRILLKVADVLERESNSIARIESINSGKTLRQCLNYDLPYSVDNIRFLAGAVRVQEGLSMGEYVQDGTSAVRREPIGVVGVITPWNYPLMMAIWRAVAALAAGNSVVLKPASYTPVTSIILGRIFKECGLPDGALNIITGPGSLIGEGLARHKNVDMIAFTGSEEVGSRLSELGSSSIKKISLELGGKAPFIVFDDADITAAAYGAVVGGIVNNGEDCANSTRYYVHRNIKDKFIKAVENLLNQVVVGDPLLEATDMGPMISSSHRERVERYVNLGIEEGGDLIIKGGRPFENGYFLKPSLIYTENDNAAIVKEEIFGPVFTVLPFEDYEDVIARSNDVIYGLGSSIWTKDVTRAMKATRDLRFGTVWVNEHVVVPSEMPWAGFKRSGHGASLSKYSIEEFQYIKHVYFDLTGRKNKDWYSTIFQGEKIRQDQN